MLDKMRGERANEEFKDLIPKNSIYTPKYSLSVRISSITRFDDDEEIAEYSIIFSITNLTTGLVAWDYISRIDKEYKIPRTRKNVKTQSDRQSDLDDYEWGGFFIGANIGFGGISACIGQDSFTNDKKECKGTHIKIPKMQSLMK